MRRLAWFSFLPAAVVVLAAGCGSPSVPAQPAYDADVRPILMAHCVRCHGAGGSLNVPTEPTGPNAPTLPSISDSSVLMSFDALNLYVDQYDSTGDCTSNPPSNCKQGAEIFATTIAGTVHASAKPPTAMPPAPAPRLDDWAIEILDNWSNEKPKPVCSNSPDPDNTICPNGP